MEIDFYGVLRELNSEYDNRCRFNYIEWDEDRLIGALYNLQGEKYGCAYNIEDVKRHMCYDCKRTIKRFRITLLRELCSISNEKLVKLQQEIDDIKAQVASLSNK